MKTPTGEVPLLAKRVERNGQSLWLVSDTTLREVPSLFQAVANGSATIPWLERLPEGPVVAGAPLSHWLTILIAACISFAIAWALTGLRGPNRAHGPAGRPETKLSRLIEASAGSLRILIALLFFGILLQWLGVTVVARYRALFVMQLVGWLAVVWLMWR